MPERIQPNLRSIAKFTGCILLLAGAITCLAIALRIEYLDWQLGGAIQRKLEQEPHSKWRVGEGFLNTMQEAEARIRTRDAVPSDIPLTLDQHEEALEFARLNPRPTRHDELGHLLRGWAPWQFILAPLLAVVSFVGAIYAQTRRRTCFYLLTMLVGMAGVFLAGYRDYLGAAGW